MHTNWHLACARQIDARSNRMSRESESMRFSEEKRNIADCTEPALIGAAGSGRSALWDAILWKWWSLDLVTAMVGCMVATTRRMDIALPTFQMLNWPDRRTKTLHGHGWRERKRESACWRQNYSIDVTFKLTFTVFWDAHRDVIYQFFTQANPNENIQYCVCL